MMKLRNESQTPCKRRPTPLKQPSSKQTQQGIYTLTEKVLQAGMMLAHPFCKLLQQVDLVIVLKRSVLQRRKQPAAHTMKQHMSATIYSTHKSRDIEILKVRVSTGRASSTSSAAGTAKSTTQQL
jgi:hypothetical protein